MKKIEKIIDKFTTIEDQKFYEKLAIFLHFSDNKQ